MVAAVGAERRIKQQPRRAYVERQGLKAAVDVGAGQ
jgi:hypothetical protein